MKNAFSVYIYLSRIEHILNLDETLKIISRPSPEFVETLDENLTINQLSLNTLKEYMYKYYGLTLNDYIEGIYYGQETCENLIPTLKHVQEAIAFCKKSEYSFVLVTPYVSPKGMEKLKNLFEYLNKEVPGTEIVVNDFGVLHLIDTVYENLTPVLGRLLIKMKRDARFSLSGYDIANTEILSLKRVEGNYPETILASTLELPSYQEFLKEKGIERVGIDALTQLLNNQIIKKWSFPVDVYWPWIYMTSSRNCAIAAYTQQGKTVHPTEEPCKYQCRKYEFSFRSDKKMLPALFRGNAVWISALSLYEHYFKLQIGRLIYEPYVPV